MDDTAGLSRTARSALRRARRVVRRALPARSGGTAVSGADTRKPSVLRDSREKWRNRTKGYAYAYRALLAATQGVKQSAKLGPIASDPPEKDVRSSHVDAALDSWRLAQFTRALADGKGLEGAMGDLVRATWFTSSSVDARRVAQWLYDQDNDSQAGLLGTGLVAYTMGLPKFAWSRLSRLEPRVWLAHALNEYVQLAFQFDPDAASSCADEALEHEDLLTTRDWLDLCRRGMVLGMPQLAELHRRFEDTAKVDLEGDDLDDDARWALEADVAWLRRWVPRSIAGPVAPLPALENQVSFAVMGYDQPDRRHASTNIGDHVQTLGSLAHLARHDGVLYDDSDLGRVLQDLSARVPEDLRLEAPEQEVKLYPVDRDASSYNALPDGTWMLAFGWYAHQLAGVRHDFPFNRALRPIFISFHINRRTMLSPEAIEYLKKYAPIGCRDWSTVDTLLGLGIDAFFSGCMTTTVRYLNNATPDARIPGTPTVYVDVPPPDKDSIYVRNERPEVATQPLDVSLREALGTLDFYATEASHVVTKRLHSYLPSRALGCQVDFVPRNPADVRFNGLAPLTDDEVFEMGRRIADLLAAPMSAILRGDAEVDVYAAWRDATAQLVAQAKERAARDVELPIGFDTASAVETIRAGIVHRPATQPGPDGEAIELVLALDGNLKEQFLVDVDAIVEHTSRPVNLHVLCRDHDESDFDKVAALFPSVDVTWYPCDPIQYGEIRSMIPHITVSTMDRLLLPELLADVERVLYLDIDALVMGDLTELWTVDLGGNALAARDSEASAMASGYSNIFSPATSKGGPAHMGVELIRRECAHHPFDWVAFNAGVMVLDLARMRADDFCTKYLPYAGNFGMHDQQILNVYVGQDRTPLGPEWNARPTQEEVVDPKIVHWAGSRKPWQSGYVSYKEHWYRQEASLARRVADAGLAG